MKINYDDGVLIRFEPDEIESALFVLYVLAEFSEDNLQKETADKLRAIAEDIELQQCLGHA